jgi:hypothetical protein
MSLYHVYSQTVADGTATSVVRPSDWNSAHNQQITLSGNTAGQSTISGTNIVFQGGNNVTLSANTAAGAATIVVSGANTIAQSQQPMYYSAAGSTSSASTIPFGDTNGVSFSLSNGSIVASVKTDYLTTQSVQTQASGNIAGTGFTSTTTAGTAVVATQGTNGLSMAVPAFITTYVNDLTSGRAGTGFTSTTTAGTAITAALDTNGLNMAVPAYITTYVAQTTQTQAAGNIAGAGYTSTTQAGSTVGVTQNSNGLSAAWPPFITTATQSAQTQASGAIAGTGFTSTTTAGTAITAALGTNGLSMAVPAYITTYVAQTTQTQATGNIAGTGYTSTTQAGTTVGVTLNTSGLLMAWPPFITTYVNDLTSGRAGTGFTSTSTAGTAITAALGTNGLSMAVPAYITTYVNDLTSGRAGTGFTSTSTAGTAVTAALGTNGLNMAIPAFITTYVNDLTSGRAGTGTTLALTNLNGTLSANTNGIALSLNNIDDHIIGWNLVGNTSGTTGTTLTTEGPLYLQGGNNITLSGNSNTIVIQGAAGGVTNQTGPNIAAGTQTATSGTVVFSNANGVTFGMSNNSVVTASIIANNTYDGWAPYADIEMVTGQQGQGTLYFEPEHSPYYFQDRVGVPIVYTNASNSTGSVTLSYWVGLYTQNVSTLSLSASTSVTTAWTFSGTVGSWSLYSGMRLLTIPWNLTVAEQEIYIAQLSRSTTGGANATLSQMLVSQASYNFVGFFGQSHNTTQQWTQGQGVYTATTSAMPNSVAFSQIRGSDSNNFRAPAIMFINGTV